MTDRSKGPAWLADRIREEIPKCHVQMFKPDGKHGAQGWMVDATYRDHLVNVMWTKATGFGVSTPSEDEPYGIPPSEVYLDPDLALERVVHLLRSEGQAHSMREMQLQSLRTHRSVSQEELARTLKVSQASVSQTENRSDLMLSTLQNYIAALGGELRVYAKFRTETIELDLDDRPRKGKTA